MNNSGMSHNNWDAYQKIRYIKPYHGLYACPHLRNYPPRFGKKLNRLFPKFVSGRTLWEPDRDINQMNGQNLFKNLNWGDLWEDADMVSTLAYIRGNTHLVLGSWREFFPTEL